MEQKSDGRTAAKRAAGLLREKKGRDIVVLDVRKISDFTDYLVIATGTSDTHIRTLLTEAEKTLPDTPYRKELKHKTKWAVLDYGGFVVHIFSEAARRFYNLESHWAAAKKVNFEKKPGKNNVKRHKKSD